MNVLILSPYAPGLMKQFIRTVETTGDTVSVAAEADLDRVTADLIILYGYRRIIRGNHFNRWIINCHTAYLPFNRGASPNLWSWYDATPKGVTIHELDSGIDTGPILARRLLDLSGDETLVTSYEKLQEAIGTMFFDYWPQIRAGEPAQEQIGIGSHHTIAETQKLMERLPRGWNTPCHTVEALGREDRWEKMDEAITSLPCG